MAELYSTDEAVIQRYGYLYDCYGETPAFCRALDGINLSFDDPTKQVIWKGIFEGIKFLFYKKHEESFLEFLKIEKLIEEDTLLHVCFLKEKLSSFIAYKKPDAGTIIRLYDDVIKQYQNRREPLMQLQVVVLMSNEEYALGDMQNITEAISICDAVFAQFGASDDKRIQIIVATVMNNRANYLAEKGLEEAALSALDAVIARYEKEKDESRLIKQVIRAKSLKASIYYDNDDLELALRQYQDITHSYGKNEGIEVYEELLLNTLAIQAIIYSNMHNDAEELRLHGIIFDEYNNSANVNVRARVLETVHMAMLTLTKNYKYDEACKAADKAIELFQNSDDYEIQLGLLKVVFEKARILFYQGKLNEEIAIYNDIIAKYKKSANMYIGQQVCNAMREKVETYKRLGSIDELLQTYNETIDFLQGSTVFDESALVSVQGEKTDFLQKLGFNDEYEENYRSIIEKNTNSRNAEVRGIVIRLMYNRAHDEGARGNTAEKARILTEIIRLFTNDTGVAVVEPLTKSIAVLGSMLYKEKKWEEAANTFHKAIQYICYNHDEIQGNIAMSLYNRIAALESNGETNKKVYAMEEFVKFFASFNNETVKNMVAFVRQRLAEAQS